MPNPFYTPTQKSFAVLIISQWFISSMMLIFAKLVWPLAFNCSWWLITAPLWLPITLLVLLLLIVWIVYAIRMDKARVTQYLKDLEENQSGKRISQN